MKKIITLTGVLLMSLIVSAQGPVTGTPPFGSFSKGPADVINLANLNVDINIPVTQKVGRGSGLFYVLSYNNSIWYPGFVNGIETWQPINNYGWQVQTNASVFGRLSHSSTHGRCSGGGLGGGPAIWTANANFVYWDPKSTPHALVGADSGTDCDGTSYQDPGHTTDGTGLTYTPLLAPLTTRDGRVLQLDATNPSSVDTNGNQITTDGTNYYDTLGSTALTVSGTPPSPVTYTFPNSSGGNSVVTANYTAYTVQTNFGCSGVAEYSASASLPTSIVLPDTSQYVITYEQTPAYGAGYTTGRIASITLPSSGEILYTYTGGSNGITCADGSISGMNRTMQPTAGTTEGTWTYTQSGGTTTVADPVGNQTIIQFQGIYETQRDIYPAHIDPVPPIETVYTCYNGAAYPCNSAGSPLPITEITTTTNSNGSYNQADTTYNAIGLPLITKEYDFAAGAPGGLLRETDVTYASLNNGRIQSRPSDVVIKDGSGTKSAETQISYDGSSLVQTSGAPNHDYTNYSSTFTARGNATSISQWVTGTTFNTSTKTYDDLGNLRTTTDPGGHETTFDYTDNYSDGINHNTQAFVTTTTMPTTWFGTYSHITKNSYYWPSAMLYQATDQNNLITTYTYDNMWHPSTISYPDGGQANYYYYLPNVYGGGPASAVEHQIDSTPGNTTTQYVLDDGFGRPSRNARRNGGEPAGGWDQVDTCYNGSGMVAVASYGYQGLGFNINQPKRCDPSTGDSFAYDALGRQVSVTHSDGSHTATTYSGRTMMVQDEGNGSGVNITRIYQRDGLGRTVIACEVATTMFGIGNTGSCGLDIVGYNGVTTSYSYDPLGNMTKVSQGNLINRQMTYDGLSHLLTEIIPEAGGTTTTYGYNADGLRTSRTKPAPNQSVSCIGAGTCTMSTATYNYDELHRLWTASFSDPNTWNIGMLYDMPNPVNLGGYNSGRQIAGYIWDKGFSTVQVGSNMAYDKMGRLAVEQAYFNDGSTSPRFNVYHTYNLLGLPSASTNGEVQFNYSYNRGAEITQLTSSLSDITHPGTLFSSAHYNSAAQVASDVLGNGLTETFNYDTRKRALSLSVMKNSTPVYSLGGPGSGNTVTYAPDSDITAANDSVNGNWTYTYDPLNRIAGANKTGGTNFTFDIDRNGNRWNQNPAGQGAQLVFDTTKNQISGSGVIYDAAGNIIDDGHTTGGHTYTYDDEGRIVQVDGGNTATYFYDAFGRRARRTVGGVAYEEIYDGNRMVTEIRTNDQMWMRSEIYAGNRHLATYNMGTTFFSHSDWLGSERVRSDVNGNAAGTCTSNMYGDAYVCLGTDPSPIKYASMEYDTETNLFHTLNRDYNPRLGIWMSKDPGGFTAAVPSNPQTQNRYAYVLHNPLNLVDPLGLDCVYLTDSGDTVESVDSNSNPGDCGASGGYWVGGSFIGGFYYANNDNIFLVGQADDGNYTASFSQTNPGGTTSLIMNSEFAGYCDAGGCSTSYGQLVQVIKAFAPGGSFWQDPDELYIQALANAITWNTLNIVTSCSDGVDIASQVVGGVGDLGGDTGPAGKLISVVQKSCRYWPNP